MRQPLDDLVAAAPGLGAGDLERRVRPSRPRELHELALDRDGQPVPLRFDMSLRSAVLAALRGERAGRVG
jgi:hypothetical protein